VRVPKIGYILLDMPSYTKAISGQIPQALVSPESPMVFYPLLQTDKLAYRTLQDEVSFELGSAIGRAAFRAGIAGAAYSGTKSS
jgi:hypothetical protein